MNYIRGILIILCGLPASGKSSLAFELCRILNKGEYVIPISGCSTVDIDKIRWRLTGASFIPELEKEVRRLFLEEVRKKLRDGFAVVADDLNYYAGMRKNLRDVALSVGIPYCIIYMDIPAKLCIQFDLKRAKSIGKDLILSIAEKFDPPGLKYAWDRPDFVVIPAYTEDRTKDLMSNTDGKKTDETPGVMKNFRKNNLLHIDSSVGNNFIPLYITGPASEKIRCCSYTCIAEYIVSEFPRLISEKKDLFFGMYGERKNKRKADGINRVDYDIILRKFVGSIIGNIVKYGGENKKVTDERAFYQNGSGDIPPIVSDVIPKLYRKFGSGFSRILARAKKKYLSVLRKAKVSDISPQKVIEGFVKYLKESFTDPSEI